MISRLFGARLSFDVDRVEVPLDSLRARFAADGATALGPPVVRPPRFADAVAVAPLRALALREIIGHARDGEAIVRLPLAPWSRRFGPVLLEIPTGTVAEIRLMVVDGEILRKETHGRLDPPIKLPLGLAFKGLYLDDDGQIWADIVGVPDPNLSFFALGGLTVPARLDGVLALLFDADKRPKKRSDDDESASPVELERLAVAAHGIKPRRDAFSLGGAGALVLSDEATRLDVRYADGALGVTGVIDVVGGDLHGPAFALRGITAKSDIALTLAPDGSGEGLHVDAKVERVGATGFTLTLGDGTVLELTDLHGARCDIDFTRRVDGTVSYRVSAGSVTGRLVEGKVVLHVGDRPLPIVLRETHVEGTLAVSERHLELDLRIAGAHAEITDVELPLGIARFDVVRASARADGRLRAGTDFGVTFTGDLVVDGAIRGGDVAVGPLAARLAEGTRAEVTLTDVAVTSDGLDALRGRASVEAVLAAGAIPLGREAVLGFSRGGAARVVIEHVELQPDARYPTLAATGHIEANADPAVVDRIFEIPRGRAVVDALRLTLDEEGHLVARDIRIRLESSVDDARGEVASSGPGPDSTTSE